MWSLQREETVSFDLTSKGMCLFFFLGCLSSSPPRVPGPSKPGWQGERELFLWAELWKKGGKHFWQACENPCALFLFPFADLCEILRTPSVLQFLFFYFRILTIACVVVGPLHWKMQRPSCLLSPRGVAVIAEFLTLELFKAVVWCFLCMAPLNDTKVPSVSWNDAGAI